MLLRARPRPHQKHGTGGQSPKLGQRPPEKVHLIKASFLLSLAMQGYRNYDIGTQPFALFPDHLSETRRKPYPQRLNPLVFQQQNGANQCSLVQPEASCALEGKLLLAAVPAEAGLLPGILRHDPGLTAEFTPFRGNAAKRGKTFIANGNPASVGEKLAAQAARSREH